MKIAAARSQVMIFFRILPKLLERTEPWHDLHLLRQVAAELVCTTVIRKAVICKKDIESGLFVLEHTVRPPLILVITLTGDTIGLYRTNTIGGYEFPP